MCDCITNANNLFREHNTALVTTMFANPERVVLATQKVNDKVRGKPKYVIATCCPFCGERYAAAPSQAVEGE